MESLRAPWEKIDSTIKSKEKEDNERKEREKVIGKLHRRLVDQMQGTVKMLEQVQLKTSVIAGYMEWVYKANSEGAEALWLKNNFIWLATCFKLLLKCDYTLPSDKGKIVLENVPINITEEGEIVYEAKTTQIELHKDKN